MHRALAFIPASALLACGHVPGPLTRDLVEADITVPRDGARSASVTVRSTDGLSVRGGSCSLLQANARYDASRTEARTTYEIDEDGHGTAVISLDQRPAARTDADLDVCVSTELPVSLTVTAGVGDATLDLSGVQLRGLEAANGTGDTHLDFGDASVADASMTVKLGTGDLVVDAKRGRWTGRNVLDLVAGTGDVTVYLPRAVGVRVEVDRGMGEGVVRGLTKEGGAYVNGLGADARDRLEITLDAGTGTVTLIGG